MHLHKFIYSFIAAYFFSGGKIQAQYITQMGVSNYGRVHSYYVNPSFNAYSSYKWHVNLAGFWANANNNYLSLRMPYSVYKLPSNVPAQYRTENGNAAFNSNWIGENLNGKNKHASVSSDIYGPSASFRVKTWNFGILTSAHADARVSRLPENIAHAIYKGFDSSAGAFSKFNNSGLNGSNSIGPFVINGSSRIAAGINVAKSFELRDNSQLLLGITLKKVWGTPGFHAYNGGLNSRMVNADSLVIDPSRFLLINYGDETGKGLGTDIGATYVFNKKSFKRHGEYSKNQTRYFAKFGLAILDIGRINYKNASYHEVRVSQPIGINLTEGYSGNVPVNGNYQDAADSLLSNFGSFTERRSNFKLGLPTRLVASADFQIRKHFFTSAVITQSLRSKMSSNSRYQSFIMVSPRWEYRFFEFSLPVLLEYDYRALRMGASVRLGPLYFGTNSVGSFLLTRSIKDVDVFAGIAFSDLSDFSFRKIARKAKKSKQSASSKCYSF